MTARRSQRAVLAPRGSHEEGLLWVAVATPVYLATFYLDLAGSLPAALLGWLAGVAAVALRRRLVEHRG